MVFVRIAAKLAKPRVKHGATNLGMTATAPLTAIPEICAAPQQAASLTIIIDPINGRCKHGAVALGINCECAAQRLGADHKNLRRYIKPMLVD